MLGMSWRGFGHGTTGPRPSRISPVDPKRASLLLGNRRVAPLRVDSNAPVARPTTADGAITMDQGSRPDPGVRHEVATLRRLTDIGHVRDRTFDQTASDGTPDAVARGPD